MQQNRVIKTSHTSSVSNEYNNQWAMQSYFFTRRNITHTMNMHVSIINSHTKYVFTLLAEINTTVSTADHIPCEHLQMDPLQKKSNSNESLVASAVSTMHTSLETHLNSCHFKASLYVDMRAYPGMSQLLQGDSLLHE